MSIKTILVSQPKPEGDKSPYFDLADKYKLKIDFRPFIKVEGVSAQEFRTHRIDFNEYTAVIMTSKNAIDHFFRIAQETRYTVPDSLKYFCISDFNCSMALGCPAMRESSTYWMRKHSPS